MIRNVIRKIRFRIFTFGRFSKLLKKKNRTVFLPRFLVRFQQEKYELEIFHSAMILKNLSIISCDTPLSADFILEELMKNSRLLRGIYSEMLSVYRGNRREDAFQVLYDKVPIKAARHFSVILSKLDKINPEELVSFMEAFETSLSEERMTRSVHRTDKKSLAVTAISTVSVFTILLNFTVVVVFNSAMEMLKNVF